MNVYHYVIELHWDKMKKEKQLHSTKCRCGDNDCSFTQVQDRLRENDNQIIHTWIAV
jgi:hypothetical protein